MPVGIDFVRFREPQVEVAIRSVGSSAVQDGSRFWAKRTRRLLQDTFSVRADMIVFKEAQNNSLAPFDAFEKARADSEEFHQRFIDIITAPAHQRHP